MKPAILALALVAVILATWDWIPIDYIATKIDVQRAIWFGR